MRQDSTAADSHPPYPGVNIVIAFFNGRKHLARCVESVLRHARGDYRIVLVDDASADTETLQYVHEAAAREPRIDLKRLAQNQGFVVAANEGIRASRGRDVLLLNSDTVATPEFLERLQACVYADGDTGIVSPLSNNATICSIPRFCEENPVPPPDELDQYASLITAVSLRRRPELVTAVGFCMYIRQAVLEAIGLLDEKFGRGFGEENDYCERAKAAGFRIRLCDDVFVAHKGKASFGTAGFDLERRNGRILQERYPHYFSDVADFCQRNPLQEVQQNIKYHTRRHSSLESAAVLQLLHANPFRPDAGGTEFHVLDLVRGLVLDRALIAFRRHRAINVVEISGGNIAEALFHTYEVGVDYQPYSFEEPAIESALEGILEDFRVGAVHVHHLFGWPLKVGMLLTGRGRPCFYTVHDYYCVSPNHNLLDYERFAPCRCSPAICSESCLHAVQRVQGWRLPEPGFARAHREEFRKFLSRVAQVIAPSHKAAAIVRDTFRDLSLPLTVIPHGLDVNPCVADAVPASGGRNLRVGMLGCINYPSKGARNYLALLHNAKSLTVDWHFFGELESLGFRAAAESLKVAGRVEFHGFYRREEIVGLLRHHEIDVIALAPPWNETFSYTLSEALCAGIPVVALRVGALEERLEKAGLSEALVPDSAGMAEVLRELCTNPGKLRAWRVRAQAFRHASVAEQAAAVKELYGESLHASNLRLPPLTLAQRARTFRAFWDHERAAGGNRPRLIDVDAYYPAFWYPTFLRWRDRWPEVLRRIVHERVLAKKSEWRVITSGAAMARRWIHSAQVHCEPYGKCVRLIASGSDPFVIISSDVMRGGVIDYFRVRLRVERPLPAWATIYWVHEDGEQFSEAKSVRFALARTADWQEFLFDMRSAVRSRSGQGRSAILHLRMDPLDGPGVILLENVTFGKFKPWQLETMEPLSD